MAHSQGGYWPTVSDWIRILKCLDFLFCKEENQEAQTKTFKSRARTSNQNTNQHQKFSFSQTLEAIPAILQWSIEAFFGLFEKHWHFFPGRNPFQGFLVERLDLRFKGSHPIHTSWSCPPESSWSTNSVEWSSWSTWWVWWVVNCSRGIPVVSTVSLVLTMDGLDSDIVVMETDELVSKEVGSEVMTKLVPSLLWWT